MGGIASVRMPVLLRPDRFDKRLGGKEMPVPALKTCWTRCRCRSATTRRARPATIRRWSSRSAWPH